MGIVVDPPFFDQLAGCGQVAKQVLVEAFVSQETAQALDKTVLHRFASAM
jgi:hypothetical protein